MGIILHPETMNSPGHYRWYGEAWSEDKTPENIIIFYNSKLRKV